MPMETHRLGPETATTDPAQRRLVYLRDELYVDDYHHPEAEQETRLCSPVRLGPTTASSS